MCRCFPLIEKIKFFALSIIILFLAQEAIADDFTATTIGNYGDITVMEVEGNYDVPTLSCQSCNEPRKKIAIEFFKLHPDDYDFIVIFSGFKFIMPRSEIAGSPVIAAGFYSHVKNETKGIGLNQFDNSSFYGSSGKLQGLIDMGPLEEKITDSFDPYFKNTMGTFVHELLHRWSAYVEFIDKEGKHSNALLGSASSHWSYLLDTEGSVQYGNRWQNNGNGTYTALAGRKYYSRLDLYLMGLIGKSEVPPMMLIQNSEINPEKLPETGAIIQGAPVEITIEDIIAAGGERVPNVETSQKTFKIGCILITRPGQYNESDLRQVRNVMRNAGMWFSSLTDGRANLVIDANPLEEIPENKGIEPPIVEARELPPSIDEGVSWLINNQALDGKWSDSLMTAQRDTSQVVLALKEFAIANQNRTTGLGWLSDNIAENSDYLSRKIEVFAEYGRNTGDYVEELLKKQNSDGGWGAEEKYVSTSEDTSLALIALGLVGYSDQNAILPAIEFLKSKQKPDGGWGSGKESEIRATINVLKCFNFFQKDYSLDEFIISGFTWIRSCLNIDGGYGVGQSTVYETACVMKCLQVYGETNKVITGAVNYLKQRQSKNGSWYNSAFQTAVSVNAIWHATIEPDLSIETSDIKIVPEQISTIPTKVEIKVLMKNNGITPVLNAGIALYKNSVTEPHLVETKTIDINGESSEEVSFFVDINDSNDILYYISIDPEKNVKESNENNNIAAKLIQPGQITKYDFEVSTFSVTPENVDYLSPVTTRCSIKNNGTRDVYNLHSAHNYRNYSNNRTSAVTA